MLKGQELLARIKELGKASKSDAARACGYVGTTKDGGERINFTAFYEAIAEANGVAFSRSGPSGAAARELSYETVVQKNGNLLVGKAYTKLLGLEAGDGYRIRLGRSGRITLIPKDEGDLDLAGEDDALEPGESKAQAADGQALQMQQAAVPDHAPAAAPAAAPVGAW